MVVGDRITLVFTAHAFDCCKLSVNKLPFYSESGKKLSEMSIIISSLLRTHPITHMLIFHNNVC